jgi:hypothetical protein
MRELFKHKTKQQVFIKFLLLLCIVFGYFTYLALKFDLSTGLLVAALSWSFFVLCTPVADAGFLLDFPLRLLFGVRMFVAEVFVWVIAILINIFALQFAAEQYERTFLTSLFKQILTNPYPYWGIILLSCLGTFLSVYFGDELMDVASHKERKLFHKHNFKYRVILFTALFALVFLIYRHLLTTLGIDVADLF